MATEYWDYRNSTTSGTGTDDFLWTDAATSTGTTTGDTWISFSGSTTTFTVTVVRHVLVEAPEHWGEVECASYTRLVNDEVRTGWKVGMWIKGDIKITDPNIEVRTMKDFIPLLKDHASTADRDKIDAFFRAFPLTPPAA